MGNRFLFNVKEVNERFGQPFNNLLSSGGPNYGNYGSNYNSGNSSGSIFKNPALAGAMITAGASIFTAALPSIINAFANNNSKPKGQDPATDNGKSENTTGTTTTATHVDTSNLDALTSRATKTDKKGKTSYKNNILGTRDEKLKEEIDKVQPKYDSLNDKYKALSGKISDAENKKEQANVSQTSAQTAVDNCRDEIKSYDDKISANNKTIGENKIKIGGLETQISSLQTRIDELSNSSETTDTSQVEGLKKRKADLEKQKADLEEDNKRLEGENKEAAELKNELLNGTGEKGLIKLTEACNTAKEEYQKIEDLIAQKPNLATMKAELDRIKVSLDRAKAALGGLSPAEIPQSNGSGNAGSSSPSATYGNSVEINVNTPSDSEDVFYTKQGQF